MAAPYVYVYPQGTDPSAPRRPQGVIVDPCLCVPNPVDLEIELKFSDRRNITDREFVIRDVDENLLFRVKEPEFRLTGKKTLLDYSGFQILTLRPAWVAFNSRWQVFRGASKEERDLMYTVQLTGLWEFDVFLAHNKEKKICDFRIKANRRQFDRTCVIFAGDSDTIVAQD
ncbi:unnamed protein product [Arabis nemorensis]|uniref:Uncharacterized protein n=1 Tax=Arabis nemorensis TaxID=586526 RepID=A0A565AXP3_9BRAS|nr:unnamed protein product [Arabis nemorensis]